MTGLCGGRWPVPSLFSLCSLSALPLLSLCSLSEFLNLVALEVDLQCVPHLIPLQHHVQDVCSVFERAVLGDDEPSALALQNLVDLATLCGREDPGGGRG